MRIERYIKGGLLLLTLAFSQVAFGQDSLDLESAMESAITHNLQIKIGKTQAEMAENRATRGNAGMLPSVTASGAYSFSVTNTRLVFAGNNPSIEQDGAQSSNVSANLGVDYTLFGGMRAHYTFLKLNDSRDLADINARIGIEEILIQVIQQYYQALQVQENLKVAQQSLEISNRRLERASLRVEYGAVNKLEKLAAEVDLQNDSIRLVQLNQQFDNAMNRLAYLCGLENKPTYLRSAGDPNPDIKKEEIQSGIEHTNLNLKAQQLNMAIATHDLSISKASLYPNLSINGGYAYSFSQNDASFILENRNNGLNAGLSLRYNLFNGGQSKVQQENAGLMAYQSRLRYEDLNEQLQLKLDNAWTTFTNNLNIYQLQKRSLRVSELNFERARELFRNGNINGTQFREAQLNFMQAKLNLQLARINTKLAEYELIRLGGGLVQ